jgi:hypothetical protein
VRALGADVEPECAGFANGEVRHDLWETPNGATGLHGEALIDRQVVDERRGLTQRPQSARMRARRVDHHTGAEFVVTPQITVDVAGQHQIDHSAAGSVLADLQTAVVDEPLRRAGVNREHGGVHVSLANPHRHGEHRSRDGVLRIRHVGHCNPLVIGPSR